MIIVPVVVHGDILAIKHMLLELNMVLRSTWWRHQMETSSALLAICTGNSPVPGEFHTQRPVTRSFDAFFDPRLNKPLSKQSWGWWFETLSRPLWHHSNDTDYAPNAFKTFIRDMLLERRTSHEQHGLNNRQLNCFVNKLLKLYWPFVCGNPPVTGRLPS